MVSYAGPSYHGTGSVVDRIWRTDGKRSRTREGGERREKSGRTGPVDDRTTSVYPPAKPFPEFIIICSTTSAVCGLRPRGARLLWYQIIPRRNKKVYSYTYTRACDPRFRSHGKHTQADLAAKPERYDRSWSKTRKTRRLREANFGTVFHHFHGGRKEISFPRPPAA